MEEWLPIPGYKGLYDVSNLGNIRSLDHKSFSRGARLCDRKGRIMKQNKLTRYAQIDLCKEGVIKRMSVHRCVALAFLPNPDSKISVDHIDRNKLNNNLTNLRWATLEEQQANRGMLKNNTSGHSHIRQVKPTLWKLHICRKSLNIQKYFTCLEDAIVERDLLLN